MGETFARVHLRFFRQLRQGDRLGVSTSTLSFFIISASMASALLAPQLSLSTAADKLLECPEPLVPSGTDMRSTEAPLDVKCLASEVEQSAAAALLGLCTSTAQSMEGSTDSSPASPARDDSESFRFNTMPGLLNSWDSAPSSSTGSPRPRNSKDGAPPPGSCRFQCRYPGCSKLYASTDAVRKHCRKMHFDWLRRLDQLAAHERQMPKPALYCRWSVAEGG